MTACAAYRASDEKRAFPSHDVCPGQLRVPGSAGGQERYRKSSARDPSPTNPCTVALALLSLSFVPSVRAVGNVFCADDMLFFCLSQVCLICHMLSSVSPHFRLDSSPCRPVFASSPLHGDPVIFRQTHWEFRSILYLARHTNLLVSSPLPITSQHPRHGGAAPPGSHTAPL